MNNLTAADHQRLRDRVDELEAALVYSAFAQHGTPLHMLPKGIALIDDDRVEVVLKDGRKVTARSGSGDANG